MQMVTLVFSYLSMGPNDSFGGLGYPPDLQQHSEGEHLPWIPAASLSLTWAPLIPSNISNATAYPWFVAELGFNNYLDEYFFFSCIFF